MDARTLSEVMGGSLPMARYEALAPAFNAAMVQAGCTTLRRAAMWCAQLGHESAGLRYMSELWGKKPTAQQAKYDPASGSKLSRDLGNTRRGDGFTYRGAGPIQITGKHNFTKVSQWAHARGIVPTPSYFVDHPDELRGDRFGFVGPVWYWTVARPTINAKCDAGDVTAVTKLINGGTYGLSDRQNRYARALRLGDRILPTAGPAAVAAAPRITVPEEAIEPMRLPATPRGNGFDPNADPRSWPESVITVPFDQAGGWLGACAVSVVFEEVPGRTRDRIAGYLRLASWILDPPRGGSDVVYRPVDPILSTSGGGAPMVRHWGSPPWEAPNGARGVVLNYRAPAGGAVAIGRKP